MNPVSRLLRHNVSPSQIIGYALANLVGLAIVLTAIQFYRDVTSAGADGEADSFISPDYLIISKRVDNAAGARPFTAREIADIEAQPWSQGVGRFTAADFNVAASLNMGGSHMGTTLFLESIPDEFFDISPEGWDYRPGSGQPVPIVISKDYLTLYNFGYASSRGMPQISEQMISLVPLRLSLSGNGRQEWVDARIVGFSSRLNTIAVPGAFMEWANGEYASGQPSDPSRLIVKLKRAGDPTATAYLDSHGYEAAGDKAASGKTAYFLSLVTGVVVGVGLLISLLAVFILVLSIHLLMQKNRDKIHDLLLLGYTPGAVSAYYVKLICAVNAAVLVIASVAMLCAAHSWQSSLELIGAKGSTPWLTLAIGLAVMAIVTLAGVMTVKKRVKDAF